MLMVATVLVENNILITKDRIKRCGLFCCGEFCHYKSHLILNSNHLRRQAKYINKQHYKGELSMSITKKEKLGFNAYLGEMLFQKPSSNLARAITSQAFRNGPVEDMHAEGKLSDKDMKVLNKYMVNHIAHIIDCIRNREFYKLTSMYTFGAMYTNGWDDAEPVSEYDEICSEESNDKMAEYLKEQGIKTSITKHAKQNTRKCLVITNVELEEVLSEKFGIELYVYPDDECNLYVESYECEEDDDYDVWNAINQIYGINVKSIHAFRKNVDDYEFEVWIEY
jgi:hypothetical protein